MSVLINITYHGQSGNYLVNIDQGVDDNTVKRVCEEAVRAGEVPGITANIPKNAFANFVIDRFHGGQTRFVVRPKVPFGAPQAVRAAAHNQVTGVARQRGSADFRL